jgi:hypothetical protein
MHDFAKNHKFTAIEVIILQILFRHAHKFEQTLMLFQSQSRCINMLFENYIGIIMGAVTRKSIAVSVQRLVCKVMP